MKIFRFIISLVITLTITVMLNTQFDKIPPLGKFLDPVNGFWANAETEDVSFPNRLQFRDLEATVNILYDDNLVPHIFAENDPDLYWTQGYVTASHRLWQMEFQTHAAAGRLSEIIGKDALNFDRAQRRRGMVYGAENSLKGINSNSKTRAVIEDYTKGVNAYINGLSYRNYPFEYKLLNYKPEPWTPLKCALLLKYMANTLNSGNKDIENTNFLSRYGEEFLDLIYPDLDNPADPIVNKPGGWDFDPVILSEDSSVIIIEATTVDLFNGSNPDNGSNNWAVGPLKTASGHAILCNDPHLALNLPSIWYQLQLNAPGINVYGVTLPGTPNVIVGFTDSVAWGVTNAPRDLVDWYKITFQDESQQAYLLDGKWVAAEMKIEKFNIKGAEPYYDTVTYTKWGPVFYDASFLSNSKWKLEGYAFRWIAHDSSQEATAFYLLNRAKNHADYMHALDFYASPAQNFAFASVAGDIAMRIQGKFPARKNKAGKFLLDGTVSENGWNVFIPNEHNVMDLNPERGFVSSANQYPADTTYPYYITSRSYPNYRNRRINDRLREMKNIRPKDMMDLQQDNFNMKAAESLPFFLSQLKQDDFSEDEMKAYNVLRSWDFYNHIDSKGASYYELWWDTLYPMIWDEIRNSDIALAYPTNFNTIKLLRENPDLQFFDIQDTPEKEDAQELLNKSFSKMAEEMNAWITKNGEPLWATYKATYVQHLARLKPLGVYNITIGGNGDIINATSKNHGPSWRMIVELDPEGVKAWGHYPGGQSGNPGNPFYDNMIGKWAKGEYNKLLFFKSPDDVDEKLIFRQTLEPEENMNK